MCVRAAVELRAKPFQGIFQDEPPVEQALRGIPLPGVCEEEVPGARQVDGLKDLPTITVGGLPGSGKSTFARLLAAGLGLEYLSAGQVFRKMATDLSMELETFSQRAEADSEIDRKIDKMQVEMARGKDIVVDSRLSAWFIENPDLKVCLTASARERARRIGERDSIPMEEAIRRVQEREESERKRYLEIYGIEIRNPEIYDIVVNSETYRPEEIVTIVAKALEVRLGQN